MTPNELFALPVGTRIEDWTTNLLGTVVGWSPNQIVIRWDDGSVCGWSRNHERLAEFARGLLPVDEASAV
ncbi:MAG: hypothetical protein U0746_09530 [Gemmataceae bacterium]